MSGEWYAIKADWDKYDYASEKLTRLGETVQWLELCDEVAQNTRATTMEVWEGMAAAIRMYLESLEGGAA